MHPLQSMVQLPHLPSSGSKADGPAWVQTQTPQSSMAHTLAHTRIRRTHRNCSVTSLHSNGDCSSTSPPSYSGLHVESSPDLLSNYAQTSRQSFTPATPSAIERPSNSERLSNSVPVRRAERPQRLVHSKSQGQDGTPQSPPMSRSLQFIHQQKELRNLERQEEEIAQSTPTRREVYVKKVNRNSPFGCDIIKIDDDYFVAKVYETMEMGGEKTAAYRMGLSFGDRIVSVNKLAVGGFPDLQHTLDTTHAMTVEFLAQPWFVNTRVKVTKEHSLEGLRLGGHSVLEVTRGSYVDRIGVHKGFALVGVESESVLGESDKKVNDVMHHYLHSKRTHLNLVFTRESAWQTLVRGIELVLALRKNKTSVSKYVSHSLHMDMNLKDPTLVDRVDLGEMHPKGRGRGRFFRKY